MAYIGKEIIKRNTNTFKRKTIDIPEWGGQIIVRGLSGKEAIPVSQGAMEISAARQKGNANANQAVRWQALTVSLGWINEDGSHVLEPSDIDGFIESTEHAVIERIAKEIRILTGMQAVNPEAKPADEAKKNLTMTPNEDSGSD